MYDEWTSRRKSVVLYVRLQAVAIIGNAGRWCTPEDEKSVGGHTLMPSSLLVCVMNGCFPETTVETGGERRTVTEAKHTVYGVDCVSCIPEALELDAHIGEGDELTE